MLQNFVDSDCAGDANARKSTLWFCLSFGLGMIS
jgi:hypothetical protein